MITRGPGDPRFRMLRSLLLALLAPLTAISGGATEEDPILSLLAGDDYGQSRPALAREIGRLGERRCGALGLYAGNRHERVRENAVRAMADAGCDRLDPYLPYLADPSPWVSEAFLRAAERHLMAGAVPWLLDHLEDRRRIVTGDGTWAIGEIALRALRLVACQPFPFDPRSAPEARAAAIEVWRDWYAAHRAEPRSAWLEAGIARAREQAGDGDPDLRLEALRLLALLGPPAAPALRGALGRAAGDLRATLSCAPEEPPRVTDEIPCVLLISNPTDHRVGFAPSEGGPDVRLERLEEGRPVTDRRPPPARPGRPPAAADRRTAATAAPDPAGAAPPDLADRLVDLAPGEVLKREFRVGPVAAAGRYQVRAALVDLAAPASLPPLEASSIVRFEQ